MIKIKEQLAGVCPRICMLSLICMDSAPKFPWFTDLFKYPVYQLTNRMEMLLQWTLPTVNREESSRIVIITVSRLTVVELLLCQMIEQPNVKIKTLKMG
jgi:hypothetical protein